MPGAPIQDGMKARTIALGFALTASIGINIWQGWKIQRWNGWADQIEAETAKLAAQSAEMAAQMEADLADTERRHAEFTELLRERSHLSQIVDAQTKLVIAQYEDEITRLELENRKLRTR